MLKRNLWLTLVLCLTMMLVSCILAAASIKTAQTQLAHGLPLAQLPPAAWVFGVLGVLGVVGACLWSYILLLLLSGQYKVAQNLLEKQLALPYSIRFIVTGGEPFWLDTQLANCYALQGNISEAEKLFDRVLNQCRLSPYMKLLYFGPVCQNYAELYLKTDADKAAKLLKQAGTYARAAHVLQTATIFAYLYLSTVILARWDYIPFDIYNLTIWFQKQFK